MTIVEGLDFHFLNVETQLIQALDSFVDAILLGGGKYFVLGQFLPQAMVSVKQTVRTRGGIDITGQLARRLQVQQLATNIGMSQL
jgi:hypothetical protein